MDTLYIGDIPEEYHYAQLSGDYITLYNRPSAQNTTLNYYRVYHNNLGFYYTTGTQSFGQYNTTYFTDIPVSNNWMYRTDIDKIFTVCFIIFFMFIFVFNIVTSVFKKGGVFRWTFMIN